MSRPLFACLISLLACSCNKSSSDPSATDFQFALNGKTIHISKGMDSSHINASTQAPFGAYALMLDTTAYGFIYGVDANTSLNFGIDIRAFRAGWPSDFALGLRLNTADSRYGLYGDYDSLVVHITRYDDKTIDGSFSGSISDSLQTKTAVITNGQFRNLKVYSN